MSWEDGEGGAIPGPRLVSYNLASQAYSYLMRMIDLGMLEGNLGAMNVSEDMRRVIEAMHQVLAGGEVKIDVVHRGNPDIFNELNRRFDESRAESNKINEHAGFYLTAG